MSSSLIVYTEVKQINLNMDHFINCVFFSVSYSIFFISLTVSYLEMSISQNLFADELLVILPSCVVGVHHVRRVWTAASSTMVRISAVRHAAAQQLVLHSRQRKAEAPFPIP